ncbi:unnamed protein product [Sphagnum jensenii]
MGKGSAASALYPDFVGKRAIFVGSGTGPTNATNPDPVSIAIPSYYVDSILSGASIDGLYYIQGFPTATGPRNTWNLVYYSASTGAKQTGNLSGSTFVVSAFVGQF